MKRILPNISLLTCTLVFATHDVTHGEGYRIPYQGTAAAAQGEAFAAQADDPSALYYNPAGLTQVRGVQVYFGANFITGRTEFTSPTGTKAESDLGGTVAFPPPTHFYLTWNLGETDIPVLQPLTLGIGVNSPFGLKIRWPNDGPFSTTVTEAALPLLDIKPTLAYRFTSYFSIGLGLDIYTFSDLIGEGQTELKSKSPVIPGMPTTELNGTDTSVGFNASILITPWRNPNSSSYQNGKKELGKPRLNLGVVYRSGTDLDLDGEFLVNGEKVADAKATLPIPWVLSTGIAYWPVRDQKHEWKLEFDFEWINWSTFTNLDVNLSNGIRADSPRDWHDTYTFSVGSEYKWLDLNTLPNWEIALRGGYQRSQAANSARTFDPTVPDANWNKFSTGLGLRCKRGSHFLGFISCGDPNPDSGYLEAIVLDLAFQWALWESRTIDGNEISPTINGKYKTKDWYIGSFSIGLIF
ncbi:MAG: outer membrane protein transport protein [Nitrospirales bacterium]|nr:outer membrane protein transport protein [Nitrospira sp.]MDR4460793.1 outer membrane protein transport protein [Nitrospirales bacterium]MDR4484842.1 outer membrane protein transport protein [Nitrospirales bacterium]